MFCLEETRADALLRLLAQLAGDSRLLDCDFMRGNPAATRAALAAHQSELDAFAPCIFDAPDSQPTLDDLAAWTRERAAECCRVIICDPFSVADAGPEPWSAATRFMVSAARAIRGAGASLILAAHPRKGTTPRAVIDIDSISGGAAFGRLVQSVFWIERHADNHAATIGGMTGPHTVGCNRTLHLLKTRNGPGQGARVAFDFEATTLRFCERGLINKEPRKRESRAAVEGAVEIIEPERKKQRT